MEKQRNRGQDGAGLSVVKITAETGKPFMTRKRSVQKEPWTDVFNQLDQELKQLQLQQGVDALDAQWLRKHYPFAGEVMMGHLRYGTHGAYGIDTCHPVTRTSNWRNNSLAMAGNFNLTDVNSQFNELINLGQHPRAQTDTEIVLEKVGFRLDKQVRALNGKAKAAKLSKGDRSKFISERLNMQRLMKSAAQNWDGGFVMGGIIGNGDCFIARDPHAIRPCYYYANDEFMVAASERAAMVTIFDLTPDQIEELPGGHILHVKHQESKIHVDSYVGKKQKAQPVERKSCSFERIYFSRSSDIKIYQERKKLGYYAIPKVLEAINHDIKGTVFSFIPNTAETAFWGLMKGLEDHMNGVKQTKIEALMKENLSTEEFSEKLAAILKIRPRMEKSVSKDVKMRTFITDDNSRDDLVSHVYDITQGILKENEDKLVVVDDSIVRGTTLQTSILHMLARLKPRKVVVVSSAPQIRYPDCYGIDMANIGKLVAFKGAINLLRKRGMESVIDDTYHTIKQMMKDGNLTSHNAVKAIYNPFTPEEISEEICEIVRPEGFEPELQIVYNDLETLHAAIPNHVGDWYFSGDYITPGGNRIVNLAFVNYYEGKNARAYDFESAR